MTLKFVIEALLFASQKPLTPKEILAVLKSAGTDEEDEFKRALAVTKELAVASALDELKTEYDGMNRAFHLVEQVNGWTLVSHPDCGHWVRQLFPEAKPSRLSGPALETLAIIAYRQPIMKADIEAVRGVAVDGVVQSLLERGLVRIGGRAEVPGRPLLYETTQVFLEHFGFRSLEELPNAHELRRIQLPTADVPRAPEEAATQPDLPVGGTEPVAREDSAPAEEATSPEEEVNADGPR